MSEFVVGGDGIRLRVRDHGGSGPVLLLAHSVGCDATLWDWLIAVLPKRFRIISYDARGHGGSDAPEGDYRVAELSADALAILDYFGIGRAHVCGLSLGGTTAQYLALIAPDRLASIILADTAARLGTVEGWAARIEAALGGGMASLVDMSMTRFFSERFLARSPDVVAHFRRVFVGTPAQGFAGCCAVLRDVDTRADLGRIATPTLVIGGLLDVPTPPADAEALAAGIPGARLTLLDAGHISAVEHPAGFAAALVAHIDAVEAQS